MPGAAADQELMELIGFVGDASRKDVQSMALDIVTGLTATQDGINRLKPAAEPLLGRLFRLMPDKALSGQALAALVNLSQDDEIRAKLVSMRAVSRVMEAVREKSCPHLRLLTMLLANLTVEMEACEELLQLGTEGMEGLHMALLLKLFITSAVTLDAPPAAAPKPGAPTGSPAAAAAAAAAAATAAAAAAGGAVSADGDPCEHLGAVITNVTRLPKGREMLLEPGRGLLQALASQLAKGSSEGRRRGCSGALRNCCLSAEADGTLDQVVADEAVLERMLTPLSGGANTDPDDNVREALAEAIAALAATPSGKVALLKLDADQKLTKGYEYEEHPGVCAAMEAAARSWILFGDAEEEGEEGQEGAAAAGAVVNGGAAGEGRDLRPAVPGEPATFIMEEK